MTSSTGRSRCPNPGDRRHLGPLGTGPGRDIRCRRRYPAPLRLQRLPSRYKTLPYATPDATDLARRLTGLLGRTPVHEFADRGLDHGAFIPLMAMYPRRTSRSFSCRCPASTPAPCWSSVRACDPCARKASSFSARAS
ncbi:hypothetical protein NKH77_52685 [Streptomyces sp. M19]